MGRIALSLAIIALSGLAIYGFTERDVLALLDGPVPADRPAAVPVAAPLAAPSRVAPAGTGVDMIGQSFGTVCSTPRGECIVPQGPINSYCSCGGTPGRIVR